MAAYDPITAMATKLTIAVTKAAVAGSKER
jgi:hypothetical protein